MFSCSLSKRFKRLDAISMRSFASKFGKSEHMNIPPQIQELMKRKLYKIPNHPISILSNKISAYFSKGEISDIKIKDEKFKFEDSFDPLVNVKQCFDEVLVPKDHISRLPNNTYYNDAETVLRPHTSAHQIQMIRGGHNAFLVLGDVYRRDTIDRTHYPAFHQMEGVRIFTFDQIGAKNIKHAKEIAEVDLKQTLEGLSKHMFGNVDKQGFYIEVNMNYMGCIGVLSEFIPGAGSNLSESLSK